MTKSSSSSLASETSTPWFEGIALEGTEFECIDSMDIGMEGTSFEENELEHAHPASVHHSSSSTCRIFSLAVAYKLCNIFRSGSPNGKIYSIYWLAHL